MRARSVFRRTCCTWPLLRLASALILVAALVMLLLRSMRQQVGTTLTMSREGKTDSARFLERQETPFQNRIFLPKESNDPVTCPPCTVAGAQQQQQQLQQQPPPPPPPESAASEAAAAAAAAEQYQYSYQEEVGESEPAVQKPLYILYHSGNNHTVGPTTFVNLRKILGDLGYEETTDLEANFTLFWTWNQPFWYCNKTIVNFKPHQSLNKFPGLQVLTNKLTLSTSESEFLAKSFRLPGDLAKLRAYAAANPESQFLFKNVGHRGIKIISNVSEQNLSSTKGVFVQEFVTNPLLVSGHKFDIGVYTVITSIDPLRIYVFDEVQIRFCPEPYHPFDPANMNKYVVANNYKHIWQVPGLKEGKGFPDYSRKEALTIALQRQGFDAKTLWKNLDKAISQLVSSKESQLVRAGRPYKQIKNFFELLRFDFLLDDKLHPTLLEVNMSPFLNAVAASELQRLHYQVIYGTLKLTGFAVDETMERSIRREHILVRPDRCLPAGGCRGRCGERECGLCKECLGKEDISNLERAYREHLRAQGALHRVHPPPIPAASGSDPEEEDKSDMSASNLKMRDWFAGMCQRDARWCQ